MVVISDQDTRIPVFVNTVNRYQVGSSVRRGVFYQICFKPNLVQDGAGKQSNKPWMVIASCPAAVMGSWFHAAVVHSRLSGSTEK